MIGTEVAPTLSVTRSINSGSNLDSNHPYYRHSSDAPGMTLVSTPFDGRGFPGWRRFVLIAISVKNTLVLSMELVVNQLYMLQNTHNGASATTW